MHKLITFIKNNWGLLVVILLSFFTTLPFFAHGFFPMHDDTQVARVYEMGKSLKDGMFPVRWVNDLGYGYGYPIFSFYAPLAYYVGGTLNAVGVDALIATKIMMALGVLLAGIFMYLLAKAIWGEWAGIVAAIFYEYATYHAVDIYVRGDVSEFWAYAFVPLVFFGFYRLYSLLLAKDERPFWPWMTVSAVGYAGIILSHNLTAMMVTPFILLFALLLIVLSKKKLQIIYSLFTSIVLGIFFSAFYWLPALAEMKYTNVFSQVGGGADFRDHFVCISQFWFSTWGYGGSTAGCNDGLSFMIGKLHIIIVVICLLLILFSLVYKKFLYTRFDQSLIIFLIVCFIISLFLQTSYSNFIWESIKPMAFLQYPWRFLLLSSFFASLIAGGVIYLAGLYIPRLPFSILVGLLLIITIFVQSKFFVPQKYLDVISSFYTNPYALTWTASKISDEYMPNKFKKPQIALDVHPYQSWTTNKTQEKMLTTPSGFSSTFLTLPIAYFPAWNIFIDNQPVDYTVTPTGLLIHIPSGSHTVKAVFIQTPIEKLGNALSLAGILIMILGIIIERKYYAKSDR